MARSPRSGSAAADAARRARIDALRDALRRHNAAYYRDGAPAIGDREYDALKEELRALEARDDRPVPADSPTRTVDAGADALAGDDDTEAHTAPMLSIENVTSEQDLRKFLGGIPGRLRALRDEAAREGDAARRALLDAANAEPVRFVVEMKIDGVSVSLRYAGGKLAQALTRGDKRRGRKVLKTVRRIPGIPHEQARFPDGTVRGEIQFPRAAFAALREDPRLRPFKNERNAAAGLVNGVVNASELVAHLRLFAYAVVDARGQGLKTQAEIHRALEAAGFPVSPRVIPCATVEEVVAARDRLDAERWSLPFRTDGLVVKVDSLAQQEALGVGETAPHWARAYKFPESEAETTLREIRVQVGKSGRLTPVGEFDPVLLDGSTITRASLHNASRVAALDLREGDRVLVHKAKEIIPQVVASLPEYRPAGAKPFAMPAACPACGGPVREEVGSAASPAARADAAAGGGPDSFDGVVRFHFCDNPACAGAARERLVHFCARGAMDIDGFGGKVVEALWNAGFVKDPADLFDLTREQLMTLTKAGRDQLAKEREAGAAPSPADDRVNGDGNRRASDLAEAADRNAAPPAGALFADGGGDSADENAPAAPPADPPKRVLNQLAALQAAKGRGLARVLAALAIPDVGETVAQHLARAFGSMDRLRAASADEIGAVATGMSANYRTLGRRGAKMFLDAVRDPGRRDALRAAAPGDAPSAASASALAACLEGFAIPGAGPEKCAAVARHFGTAGRLLAAAPEAWELVEMGAGITRRTLGPVVAASLTAYFAAPAHQNLLRRLEQAGVAMDALRAPGRPRPARTDAPGGLFADVEAAEPGTAAPKADEEAESRADGEGMASALAGKTVVLTGTLPTYGRAEAKRRLEAAGALVVGHVGAGTDYVVAGDKAGGKLAEAKKRGVAVIDEAEMLRLLGSEAP